jgi:hypothetical protein
VRGAGGGVRGVLMQLDVRTGVEVSLGLCCRSLGESLAEKPSKESDLEYPRDKYLDQIRNPVCLVSPTSSQICVLEARWVYSVC